MAVYTVHGPCTAMYTVRTRWGTGRVPGRVLPRTGCVHGRVRDTVGPSAWPVYGRVHSLYTAEGGRAQSVQTVYTAVHGPCTWSVRDRVHGRVYGRVDGRVYGPCARRCTYHVYGRTRPFTSRVLYTGRKHGRVQGTRPCTRPCSGYGRTMHGRVHGTYTACTWYVHSRAHGP